MCLKCLLPAAVSRTERAAGWAGPLRPPRTPSEGSRGRATGNRGISRPAWSARRRRRRQSAGEFSLIFSGFYSFCSKNLCLFPVVTVGKQRGRWSPGMFGCTDSDLPDCSPLFTYKKFPCKISISPILFSLQGPTGLPGLPGLKGEVGPKGEKVTNQLDDYF